MAKQKKDMISLADYSTDEIIELLESASELKKNRLTSDPNILNGRTGVLVFDKPSRASVMRWFVYPFSHDSFVPKKRGDSKSNPLEQRSKSVPRRCICLSFSLPLSLSPSFSLSFSLYLYIYIYIYMYGSVSVTQVDPRFTHS